MGWSRRSWVEGARLSNLGEIPLTPVSRFDIIMSQESRTCVSAATTFPRQYVVQRLVDKRAKYGESRCHSSGNAVMYGAPQKDYHDHQGTYVWNFDGSRERAYLHDTLH